MKKLTLSMEEGVIRQAKRIAAEQGTSVSAMFSNMVRLMARKRGEEIGIGPLTREAMGLVDLPEGKTDRELLEEALAEEYERDS
jgi:hypothetical protein